VAYNTNNSTPATAVERELEMCIPNTNGWWTSSTVGTIDSYIFTSQVRSQQTNNEVKVNVWFRSVQERGTFELFRMFIIFEVFCWLRGTGLLLAKGENNQIDLINRRMARHDYIRIYKKIRLTHNRKMKREG
jgi:hypothetical protein